MTSASSVSSPPPPRKKRVASSVTEPLGARADVPRSERGQIMLTQLFGSSYAHPVFDEARHVQELHLHRGRSSPLASERFEREHITTLMLQAVFPMPNVTALLRSGFSDRSCPSSAIFGTGHRRVRLQCHLDLGVRLLFPGVARPADFQISRRGFRATGEDEPVEKAKTLPRLQYAHATDRIRGPLDTPQDCVSDGNAEEGEMLRAYPVVL
ncbi:hypothetical protein LY76DRAFT_603642 [Colletotrichum caudatum]|nr:hypothetical protein LY76DRAFT_603642 [Colletotrichum caudatum]